MDIRIEHIYLVAIPIWIIEKCNNIIYKAN